MNLPTRIIVTTAALIAWMALAISAQVYAKPAIAELGPPTFIPAAVFGAITGGGVVFLIILLAPRKYCPKCDADLPRFRRPESWKHVFGGQTCPTCHAMLDRRGRARQITNISGSSKTSPI